MSDLIDRQAAIDALGGNEPVGDPSKMDDDDVVKMWERIRIINIINKLPSAQPETHDKRTETNACDCISRQAVIYSFEFDDDGTPWNMSDIIYRLEQMPSAQPERKTGTWIPQDHNRRSGYVTTTVYYYPKCSECGHSGNYDMSYCPNCGARMEGDAE